jgi:hypothetical protein
LGGWNSLSLAESASFLDDEYRQTLTHIAETVLAAPLAEMPCSCRGVSQQCKRLKKLNSEQAEYCAKVFEETKEQIKILLVQKIDGHQENDDNVFFRLNDDGIDKIVRQFSTDQISTFEKTFPTMTQADRVEIFAKILLEKTTWRGKKINAKESYGPFVGSNGGEQLLNATSAAYAIEAMRSDVVPIKENIGTSLYYHLRFDFGVGEQSTSHQFQKKSQTGLVTYVRQAGLAYYKSKASPWGVSTRLRLEEKSYSESGPGGQLMRQTAVLGGERRFIHLNQNHGWPLIHSVVMLGAGGGSVHHIKDAENGTKLEESALIGGVLANWMLHVSIFYGFQIAIGITVDYFPYDLDAIEINQNTINISHLGALSYSF